MTTATMPRRLTDRIILYGALVASVVTILGALAWTGKTYNDFSGVLTASPVTAAKVDSLERWRDIQDERTDNIQYWMCEIGKKLGVPAPPPRRMRAP